MSLFSVQARKHTAYYDHLMATSASRTPGRERKATDATGSKTEATSEDSASEAGGRSSDKSRQLNRTYVLSALSKSGSGPPASYRSRLTLQRRSRRKSGSGRADKTMLGSDLDSTPAPEKRPSLQRRTRAPSVDKIARGVSGTTTPKVLSEPNGRTASVFRSASLRETACKSRGREAAGASATPGKPAPSHALSSSSASSTSRRPEVSQAQTFETPTKKTPFEKIASKRDVFERLAGRDAAKPGALKSASVARPKAQNQHAEDPKPVPAPRAGKASSAKPHAAVQPRKTSTPGHRRDATPAAGFRTSVQHAAAPPAATEQLLSGPGEAPEPQDSFKMENSAVTVAVRVRPFNARCVTRCLTPTAE